MVLAEKGTLDQAKDVFARVREVSAEVLGDVWINLAHVYLALNKHNEVRLICTLSQYAYWASGAISPPPPEFLPTPEFNRVALVSRIAMTYFAGHIYDSTLRAVA